MIYNIITSILKKIPLTKLYLSVLLFHMTTVSQVFLGSKYLRQQKKHEVMEKILYLVPESQNG